MSYNIGMRVTSVYAYVQEIQGDFKEKFKTLRVDWNTIKTALLLS